MAVSPSQTVCVSVILYPSTSVPDDHDPVALPGMVGEQVGSGSLLHRKKWRSEAHILWSAGGIGKHLKRSCYHHIGFEQLKLVNQKRAGKDPGAASAVHAPEVMLYPPSCAWQRLVTA